MIGQIKTDGVLTMNENDGELACPSAIRHVANYDAGHTTLEGNGDSIRANGAESTVKNQRNGIASGREIVDLG